VNAAVIHAQQFPNYPLGKAESYARLIHARTFGVFRIGSTVDLYKCCGVSLTQVEFLCRSQFADQPV